MTYELLNLAFKQGVNKVVGLQVTEAYEEGIYSAEIFGLDESKIQKILFETAFIIGQHWNSQVLIEELENITYEVKENSIKFV